MKCVLVVVASTVSFLLLVPTASALIALAPTYSSDSETMASIGLRFDFGDMQPRIVGQVRRTNTDSDNDVTGFMGEIALPVLGETPFVPTVRAMGLVGTPDVQGLAGIGFNFADQQPLLGLGVQGPFVEGGLNIELGGELQPYLGLNSYDGAPDRIIIPAAPAPN